MTGTGPLPSSGHRARLRADCERCFGLCCVAPAFAVSPDFAIDKDAGRLCPNLHSEFRCSIHSRLRQKGFRGCAVYDCFGAGQQVAQVTFAGQDWRRTPRIASQMFAAFSVMRRLHELLWYLNEALALPAAASLDGDLRSALEQTEQLTQLAPHDLVALDMGDLGREASGLLRRASRLARAGAPRRGVDRSGADLVGKVLRRVDFRGADLSGARLIGADLRGADLRLADFLGADLRDADLRGADLRGGIFVTQSQLDSAHGDAGTRLPKTLAWPGHWV